MTHSPVPLTKLGSSQERTVLELREKGVGCHSSSQPDTSGMPLVAIVGCPNVGKSVLFNALTGAYVTVSNFPGTTVEVSRGKGRIGDTEVGVVDTPGMYSLLPITEEERVGRSILLQEQPTVVIHVVDAKNLERMLPMTLQLIEAGLPVILDVNLMDEARRLGVQVDVAVLEHELGVPVVATTLTRRQGVEQLKKRIAAYLDGSPDNDLSPSTQITVQYPSVIEDALRETGERLDDVYPITGRAVTMLLLQGDEQAASRIRECKGTEADELLRRLEATRARFNRPVSYVIVQKQRDVVRGILEHLLRDRAKATGCRPGYPRASDDLATAARLRLCRTAQRSDDEPVDRHPPAADRVVPDVRVRRCAGGANARRFPRVNRL
jgi:ferrous iron transport protein B